MYTRLVRPGGFILWKHHIWYSPGRELQTMEGEKIEVSDDRGEVDVFTLSGKYLSTLWRLKSWEDLEGLPRAVQEAS